MSKIHDRYVEVVFTTANGAQTVVASAVNYYRDKSQLDASNPFVLKATFPAAQASPYEIVLGELLPPPTIIRLKATISA